MYKKNETKRYFKYCLEPRGLRNSPDTSTRSQPKLIPKKWRPSQQRARPVGCGPVARAWRQKMGRAGRYLSSFLNRSAKEPAAGPESTAHGGGGACSHRRPRRRRRRPHRRRVLLPSLLSQALIRRRLRLHPPTHFLDAFSLSPAPSPPLHKKLLLATGAPICLDDTPSPPKRRSSSAPKAPVLLVDDDDTDPSPASVVAPAAFSETRDTALPSSAGLDIVAAETLGFTSARSVRAPAARGLSYAASAQKSSGKVPSPDAAFCFSHQRIYLSNTVISSREDGFLFRSYTKV